MFITHVYASAPAENIYGSGDNPLLNFYQTTISPIKGGNTCPMHPSCSQYAKIAYESLDPFTATTATCERLLECGRDTYAYAQVTTPDGTKLLDLVDVPSPKESTPRPALQKTAISSTFPGTIQDQLALADSLYNAQLFFEAASAYCAVTFTPNDSAVPTHALYGMMYALYAEGDPVRYQQMIAARFLRTPADTTLINLSHMLEASLWMRVQAFDRALAILASTDAPDTWHHWSARARAGCLVQLNEWDHALAWADSSGDQQFISALSACQAAFRKLPVVSPALAGIASALMPGTGYLYAGKSQTALAALMVNGLFIGSAVETVRNRQYFLGTTISLVGLGWYTGTIRGSIQAAQRANTAARDVLIAQLFARCDVAHIEIWHP